MFAGGTGRVREVSEGYRAAHGAYLMETPNVIGSGECRDTVRTSVKDDAHAGVSGSQDLRRRFWRDFCGKPRVDQPRAVYWTNTQVLCQS